MDYNKAALEMHETHKGKVGIVSKVEVSTRDDLSTAYTPGVAEPCRKIKENPDDVYKYTFKGNMVAVVSNGTAVLGLGNIGPLAGKPVMEGKGVLFKNFADVDVFDLCLKTGSTEEFIAAVRTIEPTFGGINLEDIKAPECFIIEETLKKEMGIPVFHDDQHGTAIISGAALLNACELTGRRIEDVTVVVVGAGAAGMACARFYCALGVKRENIRMFDSKGLIHKKRSNLAEYKLEFAQEEDLGSLADCMKGTDLFLGLSTKNLVSQDMVRSMADKPVLFAMANPDPEISYEDAKAARPDCIMGTGRSDYPNQINNVLAFPGIFRGAFDVRASDINDEMKIAASKAINATTRYELRSRLAGMPKHDKVLHGDFNPSNIIVDAEGRCHILDWSHATQGNASADAATTYLLFALKDQKWADLYLELFCDMTDTAKQYVQRWMPITAASRLGKGIPEEKELLEKWLDVVEYE